MAKRPAVSRSRSRPGRIRLGLGSWADDEYAGILYPEELPTRERLRFYATKFDHIEVNATAYRTPQRRAVAAWDEATPRDFRFDVRLHRAIAENPEEKAREGTLVARLLDGIQPLVDAGKLGAFLLVLPPRFEPGRHWLAELELLIDRLSGFRLAVELRHHGWVDGGRRDETLEFFRARQLVWVAVDMPRIPGATLMPAVDEVTYPKLAYLRLHGRNPGWPKAKTAAARHAYEYPAKELKEIAGRVRTLAARAAEVHVVANNHASDFAPRAALALQRLLA